METIDISNINNDLNTIESNQNACKLNQNDYELNQNDDELNQNDYELDWILNSAEKVFNTIECGFIEYIYHKALLIELNKKDYMIESKKIISISYDSICIGYVESDIVLHTKSKIYILELKAFDRNISQKEVLQINKYIKYIENIDNKEIIGVIINFNQKTKKIDKMII